MGVQSEHADPVFRYYLEEDPEKRAFVPITVQPSVAQAAMIGNPVSMPRVIEMVREYNHVADAKKVFVVQVKEQEVMDSMIMANRNGNISCTQGGESMAGLRKAVQEGYVRPGEVGIIDSTAHMLKFLTFQDMYFHDSFGPEYNIKPRPELKNAPTLVRSDKITKYPEPGKPLQGKDMSQFIDGMTDEIARILRLEAMVKAKKQ